jgi:hypothetical protein
MPRTLFDKRPRYSKLLDLINGRAKTDGITRVMLAEMIGHTEPTMIARMQHPENFTLDELARIGRGLHIPIEELRQAIQY